MLRWLLIAPLLLVVVLFALSNGTPVALRLWPFDLTWQAPLSVAVLVIAGGFFLIGAGIAWVAAMPARGRARALAHEVAALERQIATLRAEREAMAPAGQVSTSRALGPVA